MLGCTAMIIRLMLMLAGTGLLAFGLQSVTRAATFEERQTRMAGITYKYKIVKPENWSRRKKWPVVLFLHGAGERGNDNLAQTRVGLGPALGNQPSRSAVFVMPQCPLDRWWSEPEMQNLALQALNEAVTEFKGDSSRLYLTGLSMGGYGTWVIVKNNPKKFAALAVICGGVKRPAGVPVPASMRNQPEPPDPYGSVAEKVGSTPVWVFHGGADPVVPVRESKRMVEAIKAVKGDVKYTEYDGVGHNSWDMAYGEADFFTWLLSKRLKKQH